jgi:hypothetical protein
LYTGRIQKSEFRSQNSGSRMRGPFEEALEGVGREVGEGRYGQVGGEGGAVAADSDAGHSGAAGGFDSGGRVFHDHGLGGN